MKYIVWLNQKMSEEQRARVGNKAFSLSTLLALGYPVPHAAVIKTSAYNRFLKENALTDKIERVLRPLEDGDLGELENTCSKICSWFNQYQLSPNVAAEVEKSLPILLDNKRKKGIAVRSSATVEGRSGLSFAGCFRTFLNVCGLRSVFSAVRNCWASMFSAQAVSYRIKRRIPLFDGSMAVLLQRMVDARISGNVTTYHLTIARSDLIVVESCVGTGEHLTSGAIYPERFVLDKNTLEIVERKTIDRPVLNISLLLEIARRALTIERIFKCPQNIEWSVSRVGRVYILQTRPLI